jgi:hypothetical protein
MLFIIKQIKLMSKVNGGNELNTLFFDHKVDGTKVVKFLFKWMQVIINT